MQNTKVIIIGTGAAGLMAGRMLKQKHIPFTILESTEHVGGRAQTLKGHPHFEYGPEYLHGKTPITDLLMEEFKLPYYDLNPDYHLFKNGKLHPTPDFWERLCGVLSDIKVDGKDMSFKDYIRKYDHHPKEDQEMAMAFIEGFDAADLDQVSSKSLAQMKDQACDIEMRRMRRPLNGYGELMEKIAEDLLPNILFAHHVEEIIWKENEVTVNGYRGKVPFEMKAQKVIDTVSVGVLKFQQISPRPKELDQFLEHVEMGQVVKLVAELTADFFHRFKNNTFPFVASPDLNFSAWWTTTPIHSNTITAWAGGERARNLFSKSDEELKELYLRELGMISGASPDEMKNYLISIHHHDYAHDPSFLGAYSYPKVSDNEEPTQTVIKDTLYFAGEAFHEEMSGTVEGAFASGKMAAERIIETGL